MNRRQFIGSGSLALAAGAVSSVALVGAGGDTFRTANVVFDNRFPEARAFGANAAGRGMTALAFITDPTELWHDRLRPDLLAGIPIIGMSTAGVRFCLELMAGTDGRLTHLARHDGDRAQPAARIPAWVAAAFGLASEQAECGNRGERTRPMSHPCHQPAHGEFETWALVPRLAHPIRNGI